MLDDAGDIPDPPKGQTTKISAGLFQKVKAVEFLRIAHLTPVGSLANFNRLRMQADLKPLLLKWAQIEANRLGLFTPVLLGIGIGWYFSLKSEPCIALAIGPLLALVILALISRKVAQPVWRIIVALIMIQTGFAAATLRTHTLDTQLLDRQTRFVDISGRLETIENRINDQRFVIVPNHIEGLAQDQLPTKLRVTWRGERTLIEAGNTITLRASLSPLPQPAIPNGYDFARHLYFLQIGAVGYAVSAPATLPSMQGRPSSSYNIQSIRTKIERMRSNLFTHIRNKAPGDGGAIIAAIVTGKRDAITPTAQTALRDSGLAHLIAISGLHMGLATGLIFFALRFLMALHPNLTLTHPIKKYSAIAALVSGTLYLIISGGGWSARRAFIMTSIMFVAMLADRRAFSLRNVAIAATLILLMTPEALLHPGFQMSFAAVTSLIAAYEWITDRNRRRLSKGLTDNNIVTSNSGRMKQYLIGIGVTDTIAALATAPFALFHFHRTALYSLPANIIAMPLMGLWIMPAIIMALMTMPIGMDGLFWSIAAGGVDIILRIGQSISDMPGATSFIPSQSSLWLITLCVGGIILCLLKAPWRLTGFLAIPVAAILTVLQNTPDILIADNGTNAGVTTIVDGKKQLAIFNKRRDRFAVSVWMESLGLDAETVKPLAMKTIFPCDDNGCIIKRHNTTIAISAVPVGLAHDCTQADIVVALYPVNRRLAPKCKAILFDRRNVWENGTHTISITQPGKTHITTTGETKGSRPWQG